MFYEVKTLMKYSLCGLDGSIGHVKDVLFDDQKWVVRYLVADTGKWLRDRKVLIKPEFLENVDHELQCLSVKLNKKQIEDSPPLSSDMPVNCQYDRLYDRFFSTFEGLRELPVMRANTTDLDVKTAEERHMEERSWDEHLRSAVASSGFEVEAVDGEAGCVDDLIVDEQGWKIRYLIVKTQKWWPGKKLLVSPLWIDKMSWGTSKLLINISREPFKGLKEYTSMDMLTPDYEARLHLVCGPRGDPAENQDCVKK
jgi:hypothetical protein